MGYFAQHHTEMLAQKNTVIQEVYSVVPDETVGFVRGVCGAFLFSGLDVDKVIDVLSGGERARVSLAKLLVKPGNFMIMDEPTNHRLPQHGLRQPAGHEDLGYQRERGHRVPGKPG